MSLRDQLVAKGIAKKKDQRRVEQELRKEHKSSQAGRKKKNKLDAERLAQEQAAREAALLERARERRRVEAAREAVEHALRIERIVLDNQLRFKGPLRFRFKRIDGRRIGSLSVSHAVAFKLRCGELAIAAVRPRLQGDEETYHVIPVKAVRRLHELAPELVVSWVTDTYGIGEPDEAFLEPEWEVSLEPHRVG